MVTEENSDGMFIMSNYEYDLNSDSINKNIELEYNSQYPLTVYNRKK